MGKISIGLDFGTLSVRALAVDCDNGNEIAEATCEYPNAVMTKNLPESTKDLPREFALQSPVDYLESMKKVFKEVITKVDAEKISGIGIDFTACTMLPVDQEGTPLMLKEEYKSNPYAWVKLWKHHAACFEAQEITRVAIERQEEFLSYYGGTISSEWMLPKIWETLNKAPEVYKNTYKFLDAGDWVILNLTGEWTRSACFAGYKGMWNEQSGLPSQNFLLALDPELKDANDKVISKINAPGELAGYLNESWAKELGLNQKIAVSIATIDAHSGVPGMGVYKDGSACMIMGTSTCHMLLSEKLKKFEGFAGVVWNGIVEGLYGYESGQAAVGDLFSYHANLTHESLDELTTKAQKLGPGGSGLLALDWHNGSRSPIMDTELSSVIVGQTLHTQNHEIYQALVESTAFGTRAIFETFEDNGIDVSEVYACGGLIKIPYIMQTYADVLGVPVHIAESQQAVAKGAAIFGAIAAQIFNSTEEAVNTMTKKVSKTYWPDENANLIYKELYAHYKSMQNFFGKEKTEIMKDLKRIQLQTRGESHE